MKDFAHRALQGAVARAKNIGAAFHRRNGSGLEVPERLACGGGGNEGGVAVAVIGRGSEVGSNFAMALAAAEYMMGRLGVSFAMINRTGEVPAENRNVAIDQARAMKAKYVLLLDAGVTFPPNALPRLLQLAEEHKVDILGPTVCRREPPHDNLAVPLAEQTVTVGNLVEVLALPVAMMLIRLEALQKMKRPYFRYAVVEEGAEIPPELQFDDLKPGNPYFIADAVCFGIAARKAGLRMWLDTELSCFMVNWGEAGYQLTGSMDPNAPQFRTLEAGAIAPPPPPPSDAANDGRKIEISK